MFNWLRNRSKAPTPAYHDADAAMKDFEQKAAGVEKNLRGLTVALPPFGTRNVCPKCGSHGASQYRPMKNGLKLVHYSTIYGDESVMELGPCEHEHIRRTCACGYFWEERPADFELYDDDVVTPPVDPIAYDASEVKQ